MKTDAKQKYHLKIIVLILVFASCLNFKQVYAFEIKRADVTPIIDGIADDSAWSNTEWRPLNNVIIGDPPTQSDFYAQFKLVWTSEKLFVLAQITDDMLIDRYADPLEQYWNDDIFEILIDENASGGIHLDNYSAMGYHVSLDNQVVDIDTTGKPKLFNEHLKSAWHRQKDEPHQIIWELAIDIYPDTYKDFYDENETPVKPVMLTAGKKMGFIAAYCDNDGSQERENFMTSVDITAVDGDKNRAYITADVFELITLVD